MKESYLVNCGLEVEQGDSARQKEARDIYRTQGHTSVTHQEMCLSPKAIELQSSLTVTCGKSTINNLCQFRLDFEVT